LGENRRRSREYRHTKRRAVRCADFINCASIISIPIMAS